MAESKSPLYTGRWNHFLISKSKVYSKHSTLGIDNDILVGFIGCICWSIQSCHLDIRSLVCGTCILALFFSFRSKELQSRRRKRKKTQNSQRIYSGPEQIDEMHAYIISVHFLFIPRYDRPIGFSKFSTILCRQQHSCWCESRRGVSHVCPSIMKIASKVKK